MQIVGAFFHRVLDEVDLGDKIRGMTHYESAAIIRVVRFQERHDVGVFEVLPLGRDDALLAHEDLLYAI